MWTDSSRRNAPLPCGARKIDTEPADLSGDSVWEIEGPMGERALWNTLFREMKEAL